MSMKSRKVSGPTGEEPGVGVRLRPFNSRRGCETEGASASVGALNFFLRMAWTTKASEQYSEAFAYVGGTSYGFPGSRDRSNLGHINPCTAVRFRKSSAGAVLIFEMNEDHYTATWVQLIALATGEDIAALRGGGF
jgi:hypothetical protein